MWPGAICLCPAYPIHRGRFIAPTTVARDSTPGQQHADLCNRSLLSVIKLAGSGNRSFSDVLVPCVLAAVVLVALLTIVAVFVCYTRPRRRLCPCCRESRTASCPCHDDDVISAVSNGTAEVQVVTSDRVSSLPRKKDIIPTTCYAEAGFGDVIKDSSVKCSRCHHRDTTAASNVAT